MNWLGQVENVLAKYTNPNPMGSAPDSSTEVIDHYDQVAKTAPKSVLSEGLSEAFRSDRTPPLSNMVAQLFNKSDSGQKSGLLSILMGAVGPSLLAKFGLSQDSSATRPVAAPDIQAAVSAAEQKNPGVVDEISSFYSQHPDLVKNLGGAALAIALAKIANSTHAM